MHKIILKAAIVIIFTISIIVSGVLGLELWANRDIPFDSKSWQRGNIAQTTGSGIEPFRHRMVNDLLEQHLRIGMTKNEILLLLGDPWPGNDISWKDEWRYWLNDYFGFDVFPVCAEALILNFSQEGKISNISVSEC